ncbi:unnamed protein product, partial [Ranitomeya imitator]
MFATTKVLGNMTPPEKTSRTEMPPLLWKKNPPGSAPATASHLLDFVDNPGHG